MNKLLKAPPDKAARSPALGPANPPRLSLVANDDIPIHQPGIEVLIRDGHQVDAAKALRHNTGYQHWGINE